MGLDMYMFRVKKGAEKYLKDNKMGKLFISFFTPFNIRPYKFDMPHCKNVDKYFKELAYWRKANAIHNWFVKNVQAGVDDSEPYPVLREQLTDLLNTCKTVLDCSELLPPCMLFVDPNKAYNQLIKDPTVARELLPTLDGYFFGSTEYDSNYVYDIEKTIKFVTEILDKVDFENNTVFYNSWS